MQETQKDPLEKGMATHSSLLAWRISWKEEPSGLLRRVTKSQTQLSNFPFTFPLPLIIIKNNNIEFHASKDIIIRKKH